MKSYMQYQLNWIFLLSQRGYNCPSSTTFEVDPPPTLLANWMIPPIPSPPPTIRRTVVRRFPIPSCPLQTILHHMLFSHRSLPHNLEERIKRNKTCIQTRIESGMMCPSNSTTTVAKGVGKNN